jgi:hypothetical protein
MTRQYKFAVEAAERDVRGSPALRRWASERGLDWARDVAYLFHFLDRYSNYTLSYGSVLSSSRVYPLTDDVR